MDISVIIPAYNEEGYISNTIRSIVKRMPLNFQYEVIVVDHGSSDRTACIAKDEGAIVVNGSGLKTIAALRNFGVAHSTGKNLFFIDADITFTSEWSKNISKVVQELNDNPNQICGSLPKIPESSSLIMKCWFEPKALESSPKYIGSCHLLTSRVLFDRIGGFPEEMETAEEFTFCIRATKSGATLSARPELVVTHHGAPVTLLDFTKREVWHGRGDWSSLSSIKSSKIAVLTLIFLFLHVAFTVSLVFDGGNFYSIILGGSAILLCLLASVIKFYKHGVRFVLINSMTFYVYFCARCLSLFSAIFSRKFKKRTRI